MTLKLSFKLDTDAFIDPKEAARIIRDAADYVEWQLQGGYRLGAGFAEHLLDDDGRTVGTFSLL